MNDPIDFGSSVLLGIVQGITEFLPISSDGHLALASRFLGDHASSLAYVVLLHAGTLLATFLVLAPELASLGRAVVGGLGAPRDLAASASGREILAVIAATIPTGIIGLALEDRVEPWSDDLVVVGACLLLSGLLVASTFRTTGGSAEWLNWRAAIVVGIAQGLAVLPGLSRSGSTIAVGMALGLSAPAAFRFSFLLSLPAVSGAVLLELGHRGAFAHLHAAEIVGAVAAFVSGVVALSGLRRIVSRGRLWVFAIYLFPLGILTLLAGVAWAR